MNIAHILTFSRLLICPIFPLLYMEYEWLGIPFLYLPWVMLSLLLLCEFSDVFDGMIARSLNQVTNLGKILDPIADTAIHLSLFFTFTHGIVQLPLVFVFVFLYRELFVSALRTVCALEGVALAARMSGKIKTLLQAVVCVLIIFMMFLYAQGSVSLELFRTISFYLTGIAAVYTVFSVGDYVYANRIFIKRAFA